MTNGRGHDASVRTHYWQQNKCLCIHNITTQHVCINQSFRFQLALWRLKTCFFSLG